jgi:beta-glucosidase
MKNGKNRKPVGRQEAEARAKDLLSKMTLREKVGQLNQHLYGFNAYTFEGGEVRPSDVFKEEVEKYSGLGTLYGLYRADPWSGRNYKTGLTGSTAIHAYNELQEYVLSHSRLKIPMMMSTECPHGHQALDGYLLPVNLAAGATFNPALVSDAFGVVAEQIREMGVDLALLSLLDVDRDPRWGRSEECFSEDPYLCAEMAGAVTESVQKHGVFAVAKCLAGQGEGTGGINSSAARIGERELREIHLPSMAACCRENVQGVMAAYNEIDGIYCNANYHLLTEILRGEMGFDGVVMSDGLAIDNLDAMTGDNVKSGAIALRAGVDMGLWDTAFGRLEEAVLRGYVKEEDVDRAAFRILRMKFERGLFDEPFLDEEKPLTAFDYETYPQSLKMARESAVLLKNGEKSCVWNSDCGGEVTRECGSAAGTYREVLPIGNGVKSIAVIGPDADDVYCMLGDYTPQVKRETVVTVREGIVRIAAEQGIKVLYASGESHEEAEKLASEADMTVLVCGGSSSRFGKVHFDRNGAAITDLAEEMDCGEGVDLAGVELKREQQELIRAVNGAAHREGKKTAAILIGGRAYCPGPLLDADALIYAFYPGPQGGKALAEILFGRVNPSGRLPVSVPRNSGQIPVCYNHKNSWRGVHYANVPDGPAFTFGDGFGYSTFTFENVRVSAAEISLAGLKEDGITVTFRVRNSSGPDGYVVPLLYIEALQGTVVRRVKELKAMDKIFVPAGSAKELSLHLDSKAFAEWNSAMKHETAPGRVRLMLEESGSRVFTGEICITE